MLPQGCPLSSLVQINGTNPLAGSPFVNNESNHGKALSVLKSFQIDPVLSTYKFIFFLQFWRTSSKSDVLIFGIGAYDMIWVYYYYQSPETRNLEDNSDKLNISSCPLILFLPFFKPSKLLFTNQNQFYPKSLQYTIEIFGNFKSN